MTNQKQLQKSFIQKIEEENNIEAQNRIKNKTTTQMSVSLLTLAKNLERH